jgi:hypothetical protein
MMLDKSTKMPDGNSVSKKMSRTHKSILVVRSLVHDDEDDGCDDDAFVLPPGSAVPAPPIVSLRDLIIKMDCRDMEALEWPFLSTVKGDRLRTAAIEGSAPVELVSGVLEIAELVEREATGG